MPNASAAKLSSPGIHEAARFRAHCWADTAAYERAVRRADRRERRRNRITPAMARCPGHGHGLGQARNVDHQIQERTTIHKRGLRRIVEEPKLTAVSTMFQPRRNQNNAEVATVTDRPRHCVIFMGKGSAWMKTR
ncbi:hypothetical protein LSAT2_024192 [Lamellibrachia satsuma]|nr:hypothetical protein LSAT2_024192 [Lamellibrachia satsuma]